MRQTPGPDNFSPHAHPGVRSRQTPISRLVKGVPMAHQGSLELLTDPVAEALLESVNPAQLAYTWTDGSPRSCRSGSTGLAINSSLDHRPRPPSSSCSPQAQG